MIQNPLKSRKLRFGGVAAAITVVVIVFIVLLNVVVTALFKKFPLNIDLTENQIFQISDDTKRYISELNADVDIYVLNTEDRFTANTPPDYYVQANEVIRKYAQLSGRVRLSYVDLLRNPDFASRYPGQDLELNDILVAGGTKSRVLKYTDLFNIRTQYFQSYIVSSKAEQAMTSAILAVSSGAAHTASVLSGYGEDDISAFTDLLTLNNWEVQTQNLMTEAILPQAQVLILSAPSRDIAVEDLKKLDAFLDEGNNRVLFYLASAEQPPLPNLAAFLAEWGIEVEPGVVFESNQNLVINNSPFMGLLEYAEEEYSKSQAAQGIFPIVPQSRPLKALFDAARYRRVKILLRYSASAGIRPSDAGIDWEPNLNALEGNVPALLLSSQTRNNASGDLVSNHVLAAGSSLALNRSILGSPNLSNSGYFLDTLGTLAGKADSIYIMDKSLGMDQLGISTGRSLLLGAIFVALLPLGVLIAGIVVWLRRRHK
ncbi:MAG: GldG family protein [Treponema sp.]|jgi:hypothetical protein|nr:GldG family protein [Treponema sp.]